MELKTNDTRQLIAYARQLEDMNATLRDELKKAKAECKRLVELRRRDREIAAHYRAIVEGDVA